MEVKIQDKVRVPLNDPNKTKPHQSWEWILQCVIKRGTIWANGSNRKQSI